MKERSLAACDFPAGDFPADIDFDWYPGSAAPAMFAIFNDPKKISVNPATAADRCDAAGMAAASCAGR